jgi:GPH family glycoside/pentoside/hexuronide:cation symporter
MSDTQAAPSAGPPLLESATSPTSYGYSAPSWQIHAWGIGAIASYFMYEQFYLIANIHTTTFKVNPTLVGAILALPRLVDGILDPLIGHWSDNMRGRFGRRRPFLLFSGILGAILASAIFWMSPESSQWVKGVILSFAAVSLFTACGTYDMAFTAMGYELSDDYADRSRVQAIKSVYWSLMGIVGGYMIGLATNPLETGDDVFGGNQKKFDWIDWVCQKLFHTGQWKHFVTDWWHSWRPAHGFSSEAAGFRWMSAIVSALILVSLFFPLIWSKERFQKVNRTHVDVWKGLRATLRCRPFLIILILNVARGAGTLPRQLFFYVGVYYVCYGDKAMYTNAMAGDFAVWGFLLALLVWPLARPITRFIGKRFAFIATAAVGVIQAIGTPLVAVPGHIQYWFWFNLVFLPIGMVLGAASAGIMPDICDIDELEYGERREGMFTAVQAFVNKMEISVMMLFSGILITWTGFDANLGNIQPQHVLLKMRWVAFAPLILISVIGLIVSLYFPITKKMMDKVRAELDARHSAAGIIITPESSEPSA